MRMIKVMELICQKEPNKHAYMYREKQANFNSRMSKTLNLIFKSFEFKFDHGWPILLIQPCFILSDWLYLTCATYQPTTLWFTHPPCYNWSISHYYLYYSIVTDTFLHSQQLHNVSHKLFERSELVRSTSRRYLIFPLSSLRCENARGRLKYVQNLEVEKKNGALRKISTD